MLGGIIPGLPAASEHAAHVDALMRWFSLLIVGLAGPVIVALIWFAIRYRRGKDVNRDHASNRSVALEVSWTAIPLLLLLGFFIVAARMFFTLHQPPAQAMTIEVVARQWMWKFQHPEGQAEINWLHVPAGRPVRLAMTSQDVIHSLYVPALRIKQDVLPGRYTEMWFNATRPGTYHLFCAEFCGTDHAAMGGGLVVMTPEGYARWLDAQPSGASHSTAGAGLYRRLGCGACHDAGAAVRSPPLAGLYGRSVQLADGRSMVADDQYLRDSLFLPNAAVTAGYRPIMPSYRGVASEEDAIELIAYLRSLRAEPGARR